MIPLCGRRAKLASRDADPYSLTLIATSGGALSVSLNDPWRARGAASPQVPTSRCHRPKPGPCDSCSWSPTTRRSKTPRRALVRATGLHDGEPVPGVTHLLQRQGRAIAEATTGEDGVALVDLPRQDAWAPLSSSATAMGDRHRHRDWSRVARGVRPVRLPTSNTAAISTPTGRSIDRARRSISGSAEEHDTRYSPLPGEAAIPVSVYDAEGVRCGVTSP